MEHKPGTNVPFDKIRKHTHEQLRVITRLFNGLTRCNSSQNKTPTPYYILRTK